MRSPILLLSYALLSISTLAAKPMPLDGIAAVVNDSIITKSQLAQEAKLIEQQLRQTTHSLPANEVLQRQVLEHLITNEVQLQFAKKTGLQVDDAALDNAIENIAKQNQLTVTQLREALSTQGIEFDHYRNDIRRQMIMTQLQQRDILNDIQVSEQEVNQFLQSPNGLGGLVNEYHLGHILIALPETPTPQQVDEAHRKASEIATKLKTGQDFTQVAFVESKGDQALNGGDLGWRKLPEIPTIFVKMVPALKVNDIPDPIRSPSGFHVIKLLDKRQIQQLQTKVEKTLVRHILIKTDPSTSDQEAQNRLQEIRQKILQGTDFAKLAKAHSADLASSSNGGTIGWITQDVVVPEFGQQMEKLSIQEMSEPFKTAFGWHLLQVLDRQSQIDDETALRTRAREMIRQRKSEEKLQTWVQQMRDEAFVKYYAS